MSELIDRQALNRAFTQLRFDSDGKLAHWGDRKDWCLHGSEVEKLISDAPTIPASPWHRVEEQLPPNDGKEVLVTDGFHVGIGICMYKWSKTKKWTQEAVWYKWNLNDYGYPMKKFKTDTHIKAWMPLPEPPKEDE